MSMNPAAILTLISELYEQAAADRRRIKELEAALAVVEEAQKAQAADKGEPGDDAGTE